MSYNVKIKNPMQNQVIIENIQDSEEVFYNITNLVLEGGTKAMLINGGLMTADGETLILQDVDDSNQYSFEENSGEHIIITDKQEQQLLDEVNSQNIHIDSNFVEYVQDEDPYIIEGEDSEVILVQQNGLPLQWNIKDEHELADPIKMVELKDDYREVEDVIDLEQLLNQQGIMQVEGGNYQYAILKNGKFHLQTGGHVYEANNTDVYISDGIEGESLRQESTSNNSLDNIQNLSAIKGRNLLTGQPITLAKYMDKIHNNIHKESHFKKGAIEKRSKIYTETVSPLKKLINKKIPIGRTEQGQLLIGKIVNVTKRTPETATNLATETNISLLKKQNIHFSSVVDTIVSPNYIKNNNLVTYARQKKMNASTATDKIPIVSLNKASVESVTEVATEEPTKSNVNKPSVIEVKTEKISKSDTLKDLVEQSNIVVHKKIISKECFDVIARTLSGLMNMDSVVKKLKNRTIILKVLEKTYDHDTSDFKKSVSYCSGYMVREYILNDEQNNLSEVWTFIPDANSKDIILGDSCHNSDKNKKESDSEKFVNVTIQITVNSDGGRTSRVIIDPPSAISKFSDLKNNIKSKSFGDSPLRKSSTSEFDCTICHARFSNKKEIEDHISQHDNDGEKSTFECVECSKSFPTPLQLENHMSIHFKPSKCRFCTEKFANIALLRKHLVNHMTSTTANHKTESNVSESVKNKNMIQNQRPRQNQSETQKIEPRVFGCNICGRQFSRHSNLQRHVEIHKGEGAMFQCTICSCSYHYISSLTRHMIACHMDTTKRPPQFKDVPKIPNQQETNENSNVQIIPLVEIDGIMQFESVDLSMDTIENIHEGMEILEIPVEPNVVMN